jgi:hypothetical protein
MLTQYAGALVILAACTPSANSSTAAASASKADSSFKAMDHRHGEVVGADPSSLAHRFVSTPSGGDVILDRKAGDTLTISQIRTHLDEIAKAFSTGDFSTPMMIHEKAADGADVMTRKASVIKYNVESTPTGGTLHIRTSDSEALAAIHRFIAFQVREHRT